MTKINPAAAACLAQHSVHFSLKSPVNASAPVQFNVIALLLLRALHEPKACGFASGRS